jgi:uncharacterized membrane protein
MKPPQPETPVPAEQSWSDERLDHVIGNLLRAGVLLAAAVVAFGGVLFVAQHGQSPSSRYSTFEPDTEGLRVARVLDDVLALRSRGWIALGLLLLIATPVARVVISSAAFLLQRDFLYVCITLLVLAVLLFSLFSGQAG